MEASKQASLKQSKQKVRTKLENCAYRGSNPEMIQCFFKRHEGLIVLVGPGVVIVPVTEYSIPYDMEKGALVISVR